MAKYKNKPTIIDAIQWDGWDETYAIICEMCKNQNVRHLKNIDKLQIDILKDMYEAQPGDYIIKGIKGECCLCKPDIFEMTYEAV